MHFKRFFCRSFLKTFSATYYYLFSNSGSFPSHFNFYLLYVILLWKIFSIYLTNNVNQTKSFHNWHSKSIFPSQFRIYTCCVFLMPSACREQLRFRINCVIGLIICACNWQLRWCNSLNKGHNPLCHTRFN